MHIPAGLILGYFLWSDDQAKVHPAGM